MKWNKTHKPTAQIIPFPMDRAKERKPVDDGGGKLGQILLYTGVRYERWDDAEADWHGDNHRPPRRGGSRS